MKAKLFFSGTLFLLTVSGINPQLALAEGGKLSDRYGNDGRSNWTEQSIQDLERKIQENKLKRMQEESQMREAQIGQLYRPQVKRPLPIPQMKPIVTIEETKTLPEINLVEKIEISAPVEVILEKKPIRGNKTLDQKLTTEDRKIDHLDRMNKKIAIKNNEYTGNIRKMYAKEALKSLSSFHLKDAYNFTKAHIYARQLFKKEECQTPSRFSSWLSNIKSVFNKKSPKTEAPIVAPTLSPDFLKNCVASYEGGYTHEGMLRLTPSLILFPTLNDSLSCKELDPDVFAKIVKDQFTKELEKNSSLKELFGGIASIDSDEAKKEFYSNFITNNHDLYARAIQPFFKVAKIINENQGTTKMSEGAMTNIFFMMVSENPLDKNSPETQGMLWILKHLE